jgi:hypothetical protein
VYAAAILLAVSLLATACSSVVSPTAPAGTGTVDVLDFIVGAADRWPRIGDQAQHQVVDWDARRVCWVKYANPSMFECWGWDDQWVYHIVDHAIDGNTGESYRFTDGRWLPRAMPLTGTWTVQLPDNRIRWFTASCAEVRGPQGIRIDGGPNIYPLVQRAWFETRDAGAELGVRDVLVLASSAYAPGASPGPPEKFYFARGAGWYRWESVRGTRLFDRMGGPSVTIAPGGGRETVRLKPDTTCCCT